MGKHSLSLALEVAVSQQEWTGLAFTFPRAGVFPLSPVPAQPQHAEKSQAPSAARETLTRSDPEPHHAAPIHPGLLQPQLPHFHSQGEAGAQGEDNITWQSCGSAQPRAKHMPEDAGQALPGASRAPCQAWLQGTVVTGIPALVPPPSPISEPLGSRRD